MKCLFWALCSILLACTLSLSQTITVVSPQPFDLVPNGESIEIHVTPDPFDGAILQLDLIIGIIPTQTSGSTTGPGELLFQGDFAQALTLALPKDLPDGLNTLTVFHTAESEATNSSVIKFTYDFQSIPIDLF